MADSMVHQKVSLTAEPKAGCLVELWAGEMADSKADWKAAWLAASMEQNKAAWMAAPTVAWKAGLKVEKMAVHLD